MTNIRVLKQSVLDELRESVPQNLQTYRSGNFHWLANDPGLSFELDVQIDRSMITKVRPPHGQQLFEMENCVTIYRSFTGLSPYQARDERLWAYLSHVDMLDYTRQRWVIPADEQLAIPYIRKHFFAREKRQIERDNSASRLWWMAHLCARSSSLTMEEALNTLLFRSD